MSSYLKNIFGSILQLFKKESPKSKDFPQSPCKHDRCNIATEKRKSENLKTIIKNTIPDCRKPTLNPVLKRYSSCPLIDEDVTNIDDKQRCRACSEKLNLLGLSENDPLSKVMPDLKQNEDKDVSRNSWNSMGFVGEVTIFKNESMLKRHHSLDLNSQRNNLIDMNQKEDFMKTYPLYAMAGGDGKLIPTESTKEELNFQGMNCKPEIEKNEIEQIRNVKTVHPFTVKNDTSKFENEYMILGTRNPSIHNQQISSCGKFIDEAPSYQQETKKDNLAEEFSKINSLKQNNEKTVFGALGDTIPEYFNFQPMIISEREDKQLFTEQLQNDFMNNQIVSISNQDRSQSCKSKIPVHENSKKVKDVDSNPETFRRKTRRKNMYDWTSNWFYRGRSKRHQSNSTAIADRSLLNTKFDRLFREFSKKIYRGNIIDHRSHSRWMKMAGIMEEENAFCFKNYAKSKVVLTLSEYKEALSKMCEDYDLDYWDVIRKMTNAEIRGDVCSANHPHHLELKEEF